MAKKINLRAMVSISLFMLIIILFVTAIGIQILDSIIDPKILIEIYQNPEKQSPYFLVELQSIITAIHVIAGFLFVGLSIIHIVKNWKVLKNYLKIKKEK
jgi:hypothetical protein